jgi:hypothetical protein
VAVTNDTPAWNRREAGLPVRPRAVPAVLPDGQSLEGCLLAGVPIPGAQPGLRPVRHALAADLRDAYGRLASRMAFHPPPGGRPLD